jgi:hypothetical protein
MAAPEIYESLTRGTLDGVIFSYQSSVSYDFGKILKSGTEGLNFGTAIFTYSIGEAKFKSLPENVRKVLVEAGETPDEVRLFLAANPPPPCPSGQFPNRPPIPRLGSTRLEFSHDRSNHRYSCFFLVLRRRPCREGRTRSRLRAFASRTRVRLRLEVGTRRDR